MPRKKKTLKIFNKLLKADAGPVLECEAPEAYRHKGVPCFYRLLFQETYLILTGKMRENPKRASSMVLAGREQQAL